jgi:hypothetical protein
MFRESSEAVTAANYRSPKTVLGFFAIIAGILISGSVFAVGIFARVRELQWLIPPVLWFCAIVIVALLGGVFITAWKDPTILMLGQITGDVYIENRRLTLGDSVGGEFTHLLGSPAAEQQQKRATSSGREGTGE